MGQDKKQLIKLLAFVKELYENPENKEFSDGIQAIVLNDSSFVENILKTKDPEKQINNINQETIERIEKYLSLDYKFDASIFPDYSFIKDNGVRDLLIADYREMLRYEHGTRNHKIDFPEFCRFATLQIEMLTNYYFDEKYKSNLLLMEQAIQMFQQKQTNKTSSNKKLYKLQSNINDVSGIPLKIKLPLLKYELGLKDKDNSLFNVVDVRNKQSHRSRIPNKDIIEQTEKDLKANNAWSDVYNGPDYTKDPITGEVKAVKAIGREAFNEYLFQLWCDKQPFHNIKRLLQYLSTSISSAII